MYPRDDMGPPRGREIPDEELRTVAGMQQRRAALLSQVNTICTESGRIREDRESEIRSLLDRARRLNEKMKSLQDRTERALERAVAVSDGNGSPFTTPEARRRSGN